MDSEPTWHLSHSHVLPRRHRRPVDSILALGDTRASGKLDAVVNQGGNLYYLKGNGEGIQLRPTT